MVVDLYEPQNLALLVFGGFVVLSFVVYAVSAFGIQEKSYEQAVAEQRARIEKEQQHQREAKRQKRKPFFEKKKREREKQDSSPGILQQEVPVVQAFDSYVAEQPAPLPPSDVKSSPAKEEKTKVKPSPKKPKQPKPPKQAVIEETVVEDKAAPVEESIPPPKESHTTKSKPPKVVEEVVQKKAAPVVAAAAPSTQAAPPRPEEASPVKAKSKAKAPSGDADPSALRGKSLISAVKTAPLKDSEIQQLIEILLNRQGGSPSADDWVKANQRNDPVSALKKQLQEKEQALHNEMLLAQSASQKVKELRHELNQQREHSATVEGQFKLKFDTQAREIQAFKVRMQQSHESHTHEMQALQNLNKQLRAAQEESQPDVVAQLKEENNRLKSEANHSAQKKEQLMGAELARLQAELQKMQSKLSSNESQLRQGEEMRHALETQISQYQQQSQFDAGQRESESALSKRLMEVSEELRKAEAVNQSLNLAKDSANEEMEKVKGQLAERCRLDGDRTAALQAIQAKLSDSESKCNSLEGQVRDVKNLLEEKQQQKTQADQELEALKKENDSLQGQLQSREKRSEAEGQEAPPPASDSADHTDSGPKEETVLLKEHNSIVADKEKTIVGLEEQLSSSRTELEGLQAVVEQQKQRNNNLREKNRKLMEVVSAAEKTSAESATQAARAAKEDVSSALAQEQASTKTVLERLIPGVSLESSLAYKDWLSKFEEEAAQVLSKQSSTSSEAEEYALKINTLEAEKEQLSSQCQHYQSVLAETEGMVNKLQKSVESEEERYRGHIQALEAEKERLGSQCTELRDKAAAAERAAGESHPGQSREAVERLEAENRELTRRAEEVEERLTARLEEAEKERSRLTVKCQHYEVALRETEGILNKLQNSVESEEVKWEERLKQTESSLGQAKGEVASLQDELDTLASSTSQTSSENARLASELEEANATIAKLRQDQEAAASSYETTSQELVELKSQLHKLKEELEAANLRAGQSNDKEEENAETKNRLASSEAAVKRLETELQEARSGQTEATSLRKQLEESAAQLEAARATAQEAGKEVEALKAQLDGASKAAPASGGEDLAQARTALSKAEEKTAAQQKEISTLTESLKKEKALTQDLGKAAAKLQAMLKKTQSALNVEKETVAQLKMQNGAKEDALGSTSLTESQVELQLADAANEEAKQVDGTGV